ncbi:MAG TPA: hypothetical protein PLQ56_07020 [Aggregatilineales bacterium]|nr:hypothetical protein [Aggregatilineales bacterium]
MSTSRDRWIVLVLFVLMSSGIYQFTAQIVVPPRGFRFDFVPRYIGGQAVWQGINPYGESVTQDIQIAMFGSILPPEADQQRMAYPAYAAVLLAPLLVLPAQVAVSLWASLQLIAVLVSPVLIMMVHRSHLHPAAFVLLLIGTVFVFRYPINLYIIAQFTGTMLLAIVLALGFVLRGWHVAAGITLAVVTLPPTVMLGYAVVFLSALALVGQWRGAAAYGATLGVLMLLPIFAIGWWVPAWIENLVAYADYSYPVWAPGLLPPLLRPLLVLGMMGGGVYIGNRYHLAQTRDRLIDIAIAAVLVALLIVPQTGNYYLVLLILPLVIVVVRGLQSGQWWVVSGAGLACLSPWVYQATRELAPNLETLLLPLHVGFLWLLTLELRSESKANAQMDTRF